MIINSQHLPPSMTSLGIKSDSTTLHKVGCLPSKICRVGFCVFGRNSGMHMGPSEALLNIAKLQSASSVAMLETTFSHRVKCWSKDLNKLTIVHLIALSLLSSTFVISSNNLLTVGVRKRLIPFLWETSVYSSGTRLFLIKSSDI